MDKITLGAGAAIVIAIAAMLVLTPTITGVAGTVKTPAAGTPAPAATATAGGLVKTFNLGFEGNQYNPAEIRVKQGTTVRIVADPATLTGCMTTVNIDGYGISKYIAGGDNVIQFVADKAGTFPIHCNMGMGNGKLIVEDSSGTVPAQQQASSVARGQGGCCG